MSRQLIARSPDLLRLQNEGYDVEIRAGHLLVKDIPYVTATREIKRGILISALELSGDQTKHPENHVAMWTESIPVIMTAGSLRLSPTRVHRRISETVSGLISRSLPRRLTVITITR